jgi:hypothetical protein
LAGRGFAAAGPPFLTNDPGTPGDANWELNLGALQTNQRSGQTRQFPQFDANYGLGETVQLTFEVPYVFASSGSGPQHSGWSNANPGLKWRFLDQGEDGWQASVFPQVETWSSTWAQQRGIAAPGPRLLLPLEVAHKAGALDVDFEAGYFLPEHGPASGHGARERILGIVVGQPVSERLELDAEIYDDRAMGTAPRFTILDCGGRYKLTRSFIALVMAGRSVSGMAGEAPGFMGYIGLQILLSDYGRSLGGP